MYEIEEINPPFPDQVFVKIFKSLSQADRRNVRLTCKQWRELCSLDEITRDEKFIFRSHHENDMELLGESIVRCEHLRKHIQFVGLCLWHLPSNVWKHFEGKITYLSFRDCLLDEEVTLNVIRYCYVSAIRFEVDPHYKHYKSAFSSLLKREVVAKREKPSFETLIQKLVAKKTDQKLWQSVKNWCRDRVQNTLEAKGLIFYSTYESYTGAAWLIPFCQEEVRDNAGRNLRETGRFRERGFRIHQDYFSNQSCLTSVELSISARQNRNGDVKCLLKTILTILPHLEHLHFSFKKSKIYFLDEEFDHFLQHISHLKTLRLKLAKMKVIKPRCDYTKSTCDNLTELDLRLGEYGSTVDRIQEEILWRCPRVEKLRLQPVVNVHVCYVIAHLGSEEILHSLDLDCQKCQKYSMKGLFPIGPVKPDERYSLANISSGSKSWTLGDAYRWTVPEIHDFHLEIVTETEE